VSAEQCVGWDCTRKFLLPLLLITRRIYSVMLLTHLINESRGHLTLLSSICICGAHTPAPTPFLLTSFRKNTLLMHTVHWHSKVSVGSVIHFINISCNIHKRKICSGAQLVFNIITKRHMFRLYWAIIRPVSILIIKTDQVLMIGSQDKNMQIKNITILNIIEC
jgi:hypothetical protein